MTKIIDVDAGPKPEINVDKVGAIILMAREFEAPDTGIAADASNPIDDGFTSSLTDKGGQSALRTLLGAIEDLDEDEQTELVALAWTGRGDFDAASWPEAFQTARERREGSTARYLVQMETLAENLDDGLAAFGLSFTTDGA